MRWKHKENAHNEKGGPFTIKGLSLAGLYTSIAVPELSALLDVGLAPRHTCSLDNLFISHGHADHIGAIGTYLGIRGLMQKEPPRLFLPREIMADVADALTALSRLQRFDLAVEFVPLSPGETAPLKPGWEVEAFRTHHPVPSLGYTFIRKTKKLKREFAGLRDRRLPPEKRRANLFSSNSTSGNSLMRPTP